MMGKNIAAVQPDYAGNDPPLMLRQLKEILERAPNKSPYAEIEVVFYRAELEAVICSLEADRGTQ